MIQRTRLRITTSFDLETYNAVLAWGHERGLTVPSEIMRAVATQGITNAPTTQAQAWAAAYEEALAELRLKGREALAEAAERLKGR